MLSTQPFGMPKLSSRSSNKCGELSGGLVQSAFTRRLSLLRAGGDYHGKGQALLLKYSYGFKAG